LFFKKIEKSKEESEFNYVPKRTTGTQSTYYYVADLGLIRLVEKLVVGVSLKGKSLTGDPMGWLTFMLV
jgi:hypothetical protein